MDFLTGSDKTPCAESAAEKCIVKIEQFPGNVNQMIVKAQNQVFRGADAKLLFDAGGEQIIPPFLNPCSGHGA